ncbi:MAG: DUF3089 domain-containing protein [Coriobacteriia bacterium]|nr:DUF3089 domain-containing protein [Coriobacteriia bacterium]
MLASRRSFLVGAAVSVASAVAPLGSAMATERDRESLDASQWRDATSPARSTAPDYADAASWVYWDDVADPARLEGAGGSAAAKDADLFIVCPTVASGGDEGAPNMALDDARDRANFLGALNMELGIYDAHCRVFAPYYRQATLSAYGDGPALDGALALAYEDIRAAFERFLAERPSGPLVLAGFSQGADLAIRLVRDYFGAADLRERLVACYALGWRLTQEECDACPWLRAAAGELDTGVVVTFNSEAPEVTTSLMVPAGTRTLAINPLSWVTTSDLAPAALNLGACFTDYDGVITREIPQLCGARIDPERGTLKVSGVSPEDYPAGLSLFEDGVYHLYDYQFFYRNLQENVEKRLAAYAEGR